MSKNILAGYPSQIRKLRKRLKQLNMEDADPQDIKSTIDSLRDLESLYKDEITSRDERRKAREEKALEKESVEEPLPPTPEVPTDAVPAEEPVEEVPENDLEDKPKATESVPDSYFVKHLVEGLTSGDNPAMQALGYDCLKEVIEALDDEARHAVYEKWENYFNNDPEFKEVLNGNISPRLQEQFDELQQYLPQKEETILEDAPLEPAPVEELSPEELLPEESVLEKESVVFKYALDDQVEPSRGTPGSRGRVMRYDDDSDLAYIHWDEGKMADRDGFGCYKGSDLKNLTREAVSPPGWETTVEDMKKEKDIDNPFALAWWMKNKGYEPSKTSFLSRQAEMKKESVEFFPGEKKQREEREKRFQEKKKKHPVKEDKKEEEKDEKDLGLSDKDAASKWLQDLPTKIVDTFVDPVLEMGKDPHKEKEVVQPNNDEDIDKEGAGNKAVIDSWLTQSNPKAKSANLYILPKEDGDEPEFYKMDPGTQYERLSALDVEADGEGIGYGGNRPGVAVAPKNDKDVSLNAQNDIELNVANLKWIAKKSQTREGGLGWAVFNTQPINFKGQEVPAGTQVLVIKDNSEHGLSQPELEQALFDNFGKDLARVSLKVDLAILKKGSEVKPIAYDAKRRELKFVAVENDQISGWTSVDKFEFQIKKADEHKLVVKSLEDAQAVCSAGDWNFSRTGSATRDEIDAEFKKHLSSKKKAQEGLVTERCQTCKEVMSPEEFQVCKDCKEKAKKEKEPVAASAEALQKELEGAKVEDKTIKIKSIKLLEELAEKCPDCFEKFVKFAEQKGMRIKADDLDDVITNIREKIKTTKERLETTVEPIETEAKEVKAQDPNSPPADDPGAGYKWFWNDKTKAWEKMQENAGGGAAGAPPAGGFAGGTTY